MKSPFGKICWVTASLLVFGGLLCGAPVIDPRLGKPLEKRARPTYGSDAAPLVVIEISSFQCPHCLEFRTDTFPPLKRQYIDTGEAQWVVINAAPDAATAKEPVFAVGKCLDRQGKFAALAPLLYENGTLEPKDLFALLAKTGGFDSGRLSACLPDPAIQADIAADFADYQALEITGTPTFLIRKLRASGKRSEARIVGNLPLEYFQRTFEEMLKLP